MNKKQLLQTYINLYENYKTNGKLSKNQHNKTIWLIKTIYQVELENKNYIEKMLNKTKHIITVRTKTRCNDDYNQQIKAIKKQCGYTYDVFNFVTLLEQGKQKQVKKTKNKKQKTAKTSKVKIIKANQKQKTLSQAMNEQIKLATILKASK